MLAHNFRDDLEFQRISREIYEQACLATNANVAACILEVRGLFSGHTPATEMDRLCKKISSWMQSDSKPQEVPYACSPV